MVEESAALPAPQVLEKRTARAVSWIALLLAIGALAATGWIWYHIQFKRLQQESQIATGMIEIGGQIERIGDNVKRLQEAQRDIVSKSVMDAQVAKLAQQLAAHKVQIEEQHQQLVQSMNQARTALLAGSEQFALDEVAHLLRMANNAALISGDVRSAINALTQADAQLGNLDNPKYALVREKINEEIASLKGVRKIDLNALGATLTALSTQVVRLPLVNEPPQHAIDAKDTKPDNTLGGQLSAFWKDLSDVISVQRVNQPPKPLLLPEQRYFLNQNLLLMFNKAELAANRGDQVAYQQALGESLQWLSDYFDANDARVASMIEQLGELQGWQVKPDMPTISGSFSALQAARQES